MAAMQRILARASYKGLLRAARKLDAAGAVPAAEAAALAGALPAAIAAVVPCDAATVAAAVRAAVRASVAAVPSFDARLDVGVKALAAANKRAAAAVLAAPATPTAAPARFGVGTVIRHKVAGYRGVVIGWDAECRASERWASSTGVARLPHGAAQPFYHVLVDVRDRPAAQVSYVAQDLVASVAGDVATADHVVLHPLLPRYFDALGASGVYVPSTTALAVAAATRAVRQQPLRAAVAGASPAATVATTTSSDEEGSDDDAAAESRRRRPVAARLA